MIQLLFLLPVPCIPPPTYCPGPKMTLGFTAITLGPQEAEVQEGACWRCGRSGCGWAAVLCGLGPATAPCLSRKTAVTPALSTLEGIGVSLQ